MSKQASNRKPLIVGIIAAVVVLAVLLVLLLTQCAQGGAGSSGTDASGSDRNQAQNTDLYWNVDRAEYDGMSEGGMSSRKAGSDGYYHIRFFLNGEFVELKVETKALVNAIDAQDIMGLVFDENGIVVDMVKIDDMPVEKLGWKFYVQSVGGNMIKVNSSNKYNGVEIMLEKNADTKVYDMTGTTGEIGCLTDAVANDRVMAVADLEGNLLAVYIYDRSNMVVSFQAECQHCEQSVEWIEWTDTKTLPKSEGHYQLVTDVQLNAQQSIQSDAKICLDLNGHTVDGAAGKRVYSLHNQNCELAIMDTSEEQTGKLAGHGEVYAQGAVLWVRYGVAYLYGGTLDASDVVCTGRGGAAVYVPKERFFYMNGGEIIGGTAKYYFNEETGKYANGLGGGVYVLGKFVLNDGVIRDGVAQSIAVTNANGTVSYKRGIGGNVYVGSSGEMVMNGGTIKNGKGGSAGNIYLDGTCTFEMNGGSIYGGSTRDPGRQGGNLNISAKSTFTMNGGYISGGTTYSSAANIYLSGTMYMNGGLITGGRALDAKTGKVKASQVAANLYVGTGSRLDMYGGKITGGVYAIDSNASDGKTTRIVLGGLATIYGAAEGLPNLTITESKEKVRVTVLSLHDNAKIGVTASGKFSLKTQEKNLDNFVSDIADAQVLYVDECLAVGRMACLCGSTTGTHMGQCDGTELLWAPWTTTNGLPSASGNYYLVNDVAFTGQKSIGTEGGNEVVNLDLNGHTIESAQRVMLVYGTLNLVDHTGGGTVIGAGMKTGDNHTGVVILYGGSQMNLYGGTLKLADDHYTLTNGGVVAVAANAGLTMYGGVIDGRSADTVDTVDLGGAVRLHGTMTVNGGSIYGGSATNGGAFYIEKNGTLVLNNGTVYGGTASKQGGAIYITGSKASFTMNGGTVTGGTAVEAGSIRMLGSSTVTLNGGTVTGGTATGKGGNISMASGVLTLGGATVEKGTSVDNGGNIYASGGTLNITGGLVTDGTAKGNKALHTANIYVLNSALKLSGGKVTGGLLVMSSDAAGTASVTLSGEPVVTRPYTYGLRLMGTGEGTEPDLTIQGTLGEKASIEIDATDVFSTETVADNADNFVPADDQEIIHYGEDKCLFVGRAHCLCVSGTESWCDHKDVRWSKWNGKTALTEGNYYLSADVTVSSILALGEKGKTLNICLNGHTITGSGKADRVMNVVGNVNIFDHGTGAIVGIGSDSSHSAVAVVQDGGVLNLYQGTLKLAKDHKVVSDFGGAVSVLSGGTMNIYGGTVDGSAVGTGIVGSGAAIRVSGTLNVLGGNVIGGTVNKYGGAILVKSGASVNISGGTVTGAKALGGGAIYAEEKTTVEISGGTVIGGEANSGGAIFSAGKVTVSGGTVNGSQVNNNGGAIYVTGGELTVSGGIVQSGDADNNGGNIYATSSIVILSGGEVKEGIASGNGGNLYVSSGSLTVSGGTVTGGKAKDTEANHCANIYLGNAALTLSGGTVDGSLLVLNSTSENTASVTLSGEPVVNLSDSSGYGLRLFATGTGAVEPDVTITGTLGDKASIAISATGVFSTKTVAANADKFVPANEEDVIHFGDDECLFVGHAHCLCVTGEESWCDHKIVRWSQWNGKDELTEGNYYLAKDATATSLMEIGEAEKTLNICLNGKTLTGSSKRQRVMNVHGNVNIYDHDGTGTITGKSTDGGHSAVAVVQADGVLSLYNGTLKLAEGHNITSNMGGTVSIAAGGTMYIYGGTVDGSAAGATVQAGDGKTVNTVGSGAAIRVSGSLVTNEDGSQTRISGTLKIKGGKVIGGKVVVNGGAILVKKYAALEITGGEVSGGQANGSGDGIYTEADVTLSVSGGTVDSITVANKNTLQLSGDPTIKALELLDGSKVQILEALTGKAGSITLSGVEGLFADGACQADGEKFTTQDDELVVSMVGTSQLAVGKMRCLCGTGKESWCGDHEKTLWLPWSWDGSSELAAGNYYLTGDVQYDQSAALKSGTVNLDLMGYTYVSTSRAFGLSPDTAMNILDSSAKASGKLVCYGVEGKAGGVISVNGAQLNIYSGTVALAEGHKNIDEGGIIAAGGNALVNICGGNIGGRVDLDPDGEEVTSGTVTAGGVIRIGGGTLNISGGTVTGLDAANGGVIYVAGGKNYDITVNISGGTLTGSTVSGSGGVIYQTAGEKKVTTTISGTKSVTEVDGETVETWSTVINGGVAAVKGGGIYTSGADVFVSGGQISGGQASQGGNIAVEKSGSLTVSGGKITGGSSNNTANDGNIYINASALTLSGGSIGGSVTVGNTAIVSGASVISTKNLANASVTISGAPQVSCLRLVRTGSNALPTATVTGTLTGADESIGIKVNNGGYEGLFASSEEDNAAKFYDVEGKCDVGYQNGGLYMAPVHCLCGAVSGVGSQYAAEGVTHKDYCADSGLQLLTWLPWEFSAYADKDVVSGNYYLTDDVTVNKNKRLSGSDVVVNLDLNGNTYIANMQAFILAENATLRILDSGSDGALISTSHTTAQNGGVISNGGGKVYLCGGTIKLADTHSNLKEGGVIVVGGKNGLLNIYDGCTVGGTTISGTVTEGGAIRIGSGTLNIYGGTINGNPTATNGGAIYIKGHATNPITVNIYGGTVSGSTVSGLGGAIYQTVDTADVTLNITGGTIQGGDVYMSSNALTVGGTAKIEKVYLPKDVSLTLGADLDAEKAEVGVAMEEPGTFAAGVANDVSAVFTSKNNGYKVAYSADAQTLSLVSAHSHCWCKNHAGSVPAEHTECVSADWQPIKQQTGLSSELTAGYYYLNWSGESAQSLKIKANETVYLCLNGASIRAGTAITLNEGATLYICDCVGSGTVTTTANSPIQVAEGQTVKLMSGTVSGTYKTTASRVSVLVSGGTFEMYGGAVKDGCTKVDNITNTDKKETTDKGGNIWITGGTVGIYGGTVSGGKFAGADRDITVVDGSLTVGGGTTIGEIYLASGKTVTIKDDLTTENPISVSMEAAGEFAVAENGKTLTYGDKAHFTSASADYQVAFYGNGLELVSKDALATCACATTDGNHADWCTQLDPIAWTGTGLPTSGSYYLTDHVTLSEVVTIEGKLNLWLEGKTITAAEDIVLPEESKCLITVAENAALALMDTTTTTPGAISGVAELQCIVNSNGTLVIDGPEVNASSLSALDYAGRAVRVTKGTFYFNGGKLVGATATNNYGGSVYVAGDGEMYMTDGTITDGTAKFGGNIGARGKVVITGGKVTNGAYTDKGGNIYVDGTQGKGSLEISGNVTFSGGKKSTGTTNKDRINVVCWGASLKLTDVTIDGGVWVASDGDDTCTISGKVDVGDKQANGLTLGVVASSSGEAAPKAPATVVVEGTLADDSSVTLLIHTWSRYADKIVATGLSQTQAEGSIFSCVTSGWVLDSKVQSDDTYQLVLKAD